MSNLGRNTVREKSENQVYRQILSVAFEPLPRLVAIVAKKWDPGILDPGRFSAQIRKVEARLGKLAKIRKVETN